MQKILIFSVLVIIFISCSSKPQNKNLSYQNIIILSDMSSRIKNKPLKDIIAIKKIVAFFKNECVRPGEKIGDKSSISFLTFSDNKIISIDIDNIKNLGEKQRFINSTGEYGNSGLNKKIKNFEEEVSLNYANVSNNGLDLISILIEKIENEPILKKNKYLTDGIDTTFVNYENHINIFTDGYLEYVNKKSNRQFYFGNEEISEIRKVCKLNNINVKEALKSNSILKLPAIIEEKNKYINLHILETHERDKNDKLQTYKNPKGLRDNEILEEVWRTWAKESGFKSFTWEKY
jgi:hypothetical protein